MVMKNFLTSDRESRFNEILFENRNKNYGAYVLRNEEGAVLKKSLFLGVAFFAAIALTPLLINVLMVKETVLPAPPVIHDLTPIPITRDKEPEVIKPSPPVAPKVNTYDTRVATPTRDAREVKPVTADQKLNAVPGTETSLDNPPVLTPPIIEIPPVTAPIVPEVPKKVDNNPVSKVDVEAGFQGGINSFRAKVVQNFNTGDFEGSGELMKTMVTFIVEKDGTISNIKANGTDKDFNAEAERTIRKINGKWTPAKLKGENVRSYFKFPISMMFE